MLCCAQRSLELHGTRWIDVVDDGIAGYKTERDEEQQDQLVDGIEGVRQ